MTMSEDDIAAQIADARARKRKLVEGLRPILSKFYRIMEAAGHPGTNHVHRRGGGQVMNGWILGRGRPYLPREDASYRSYVGDDSYVQVILIMTTDGVLRRGTIGLPSGRELGYYEHPYELGTDQSLEEDIKQRIVEIIVENDLDWD
jgi:hypothetical protein